MGIAEALALIGALTKGIRDAVAAGRPNISDADVDAALAEIAASDDRLSEAIRRALEREGGA